MRHLTAIHDWPEDVLTRVLDRAAAVKQTPSDYAEVMRGRTLLMLFEKPSLRTRISFETGMTQMGGHAIYYDLSQSPLGAGKETVGDTVRTVSRYVDLIMARLYSHQTLLEMAESAQVPVINALTDFSHPCQILADLQTIRERFGTLQGLTLAFLGDGNNNVTHSLLTGCASVGMHIRVACPAGEEASPQSTVLAHAQEIGERTGARVMVTHDPSEAVQGAQVLYTDSWMSYHIPQHRMNERVKLFAPYQINAERMEEAAPEAIFMNCLPALRGYEQTAEVIDGPRSVVFDQAENRLHAQKAVMLELIGHP